MRLNPRFDKQRTSNHPLFQGGMFLRPQPSRNPRRSIIRTGTKLKDRENSMIVSHFLYKPQANRNKVEKPKESHKRGPGDRQLLLPMYSGL